MWTNFSQFKDLIKQAGVGRISNSSNLFWAAKFIKSTFTQIHPLRRFRLGHSPSTFVEHFSIFFCIICSWHWPAVLTLELKIMQQTLESNTGSCLLNHPCKHILHEDYQQPFAHNKCAFHSPFKKSITHCSIFNLLFIILPIAHCTTHCPLSYQ